MILVLEERPDVRHLYTVALSELWEQFSVASSIDILKELLREILCVDLVIAKLEIEVDGASVVVSELVKKLRPEAAFLPVTHEIQQTGLLSTASYNFSRQVKKAVKQTLRAREFKAYAARLCHEVNNPAVAILGNAELILEVEKASLPESIREKLAIICEQAIRIGKVTRKLYEIANDPESMQIEGEIPMISFPEE